MKQFIIHLLPTMSICCLRWWARGKLVLLGPFSLTVGGPYSVAMMLIYVFKCIIIVVVAASVIVLFFMLNSCVLAVAI